MATMYVSWLGGTAHGVARAPISSETITTSGTSAQSGANPNGAVVQVFSDAAHYVAVGDDPTASIGNSVYVPANQVKELSVPNGAKIAAITV